MTPHITVCVCTFRRPELLERTLAAMETQETENLFTLSIVIADNDRGQSARPTVDRFTATASVRAVYCVEPEQNIALVRNCAVGAAKGEYIAFIDDDEVPAKDWLLRLFHALKELAADGVLGPVVPYFDADPPKWVMRGRFFDRPSHPTGLKLNWMECRTGNVLFKRSILDGEAGPFNREFATAGEDMDFFRRMIDKGNIFVWCAEGVVHELVPPARCRRSFLLRRALLRGSNFPKHPANRARNVVKSLIAVPAYTLALPVLAAFGQHVFLKYLIKLLDHSSRLLAFSGVVLVKERGV